MPIAFQSFDIVTSAFNSTTEITLCFPFSSFAGLPFSVTMQFAVNAVASLAPLAKGHLPVTVY